MKRKLIALLLSVIMLTQTAQAMSEQPSTVDTNPGSYHCEWVEQSTYPNLQPLEITTIWVKFKNTGTATWYNYGDHPVRLGTSHDQDRNSDFYKHTWESNNRAAKLLESSVAPGQIGKFEFYIKAPETTKTYKEYFQPVVEGITWMEDYGVFWDIAVNGEKTENKTDLSYDSQNGYHAAFESQEPQEKFSLAPGEIKLMTVKFKNTGSNTWSNSGANPVHLGTDSNRDRHSLFFKHTWLSANRACNLKENSIYPGQSGTFEFYIQAPSTPGKYTEYFTPVAENLTWIGQNGVFWIIEVTGESVDKDNNNDTTDFTLSGSVNNGQIKLNWTNYLNTLQTASNTISGYKVVRSETNSNPTYPNDWWVYLSDPYTLSYTDTSVSNGHNYYYRIGAYSSNSGVIEYTNSIYLSVPSSNNSTTTSFELEGYDQDNGIRLTWDQYPYSVQTSNSNIDGYKIVRSLTSSEPTYPNDYLVYISGANNTDYLDTSVSNNKSYYYRVGAYKNGSVISYSNYIYITHNGNNSTSSTEFTLNVSSQNNGIHLSWDKTDYDEAIGYKIVRSTSNSSPNYPDHYLTYISGTNNLDYVDTSVNNGQVYYYRIGAYDGDDILEYTSAKSIEFTGNNNSDNEDLELEATTVTGGIKLTWNIYDQDSISGYKIMRSETDSSPTYPDEYYKFISGSNSKSYVDTSAKSGHSYYYRIGAYNGSIVTYSNTVRISY